MSEEFNYSARELFHEGCVQPLGLSSHCSAQAPCPHALTHRSDAKWVSHVLFNDMQQHIFFVMCLFLFLILLFVCYYKSLAFSLVFFSLSQVLLPNADPIPWRNTLLHPLPPSPFSITPKLTLSLSFSLLSNTVSHFLSQFFYMLVNPICSSAWIRPNWLCLETTGFFGSYIISWILFRFPADWIDCKRQAATFISSPFFHHILICSRLKLKGI